MAIMANGTQNSIMNPLKRCLFPDMWLPRGLLSSWASGRGDLEALALGTEMYTLPKLE